MRSLTALAVMGAIAARFTNPLPDVWNITSNTHYAPSRNRNSGVAAAKRRAKKARRK